MDPVRNPYVPGAGNPPPELAGRGALLQDATVALDRIKIKNAAQGLILTGLRGVGKTVLLVRIQELSKERGFHDILIEANENKPLLTLLIPQLKRTLFSFDKVEAAKDAAKRGLRIIRSAISSLKVTIGDVDFGLSISPEPGTADSGDFESDVSDMLVAIGEAAKEARAWVCILIDEMQYLKYMELEALITAMHKINQRGLPILLIGAGLPQIIALSGDAKSYAERLFKYPNIGALAPDDAISAIATPASSAGVTYSRGAMEKLLHVTESYPYFLQQWAHDAWNIATGPSIDLTDVDKATHVALKTLDESFFKMRFDRCTPSERRYMRALAELGPGTHKSGDIADMLKLKTTSVAPVRSKLITKGMIYSPAHGDAAFTVPMFDAYMRRAMQIT
jgi:AAA ATPase domain